MNPSPTKYIVYTQPYCLWSMKAADILEEANIPYVIKRIDILEERIAVGKRWGWSTFPIIVTTYGKVIGGYRDLEKHLGVDWLPKSADNRMDVVFLSELATLPSRGSIEAAGLDLFMVSASNDINVVSDYSSYALHAGKRAFFRTGISVDIPKGHYARIAPRSGLAVKYGIDVLAGVIDEDYRGEWIVILQNFGKTAVVFSTGDRIAQAIITPYAKTFPVRVNNLNETNRGLGGLGSTGQ